MSKKKTYYFQHDCNAREDDKLIALRMDKGAAGYGIYFLLLEVLSTSPDCMFERNYNKLGFILHVGSDEIKAVVENYGLFQFTDNGERFYSVRLKEHMSDMEDLSIKRSAAAKKGGGNPNLKKGKPNPYYSASNTTEDKQPDKQMFISDINIGENIIGEESKGKEKRKKSPCGDNAHTRVKQQAEPENPTAEIVGAEVEVLPEESTLLKEEQQQRLHTGIMQGWQQHYRQTFSTDYLLTRGSITAEVADIAHAILQLMQQYGQDTSDPSQVQDFSATLFSAMYSRADPWQRSNWSLRVIKRQFNDLLKPIINANDNNGLDNTAHRNANARDDSHYLASLFAELRACQNQ